MLSAKITISRAFCKSTTPITAKKYAVLPQWNGYNFVKEIYVQAIK
jgi:hypothetical protein